jgi:glycosyltransferase involved in cell wall biosynthesis
MPSLPPIADAPISVVLLARQCVDQVEPVVLAWNDFLKALGRDYELFLVDDGSTDGTADRAESLRERAPVLRVLRQEQHGEGAALRAGIAAGTLPLLFYTICDPIYRPADLARMFDKRLPDPPGGREIDHAHIALAFRAGELVPAPLVVIGWFWRLFCRVTLGYWPAPLPGWLGWRAHAGRLLIRIFFGLRTQDVYCPFRLMRREIFRRIPIQSNGPFAHVEILAKANFLGFVVTEEIPLEVSARPNPESASMWRDGLRVLNDPDFGPTVLPEEPKTVETPPAPPTETQVTS